MFHSSALILRRLHGPSDCIEQGCFKRRIKPYYCIQGLSSAAGSDAWLSRDRTEAVRGLDCAGCVTLNTARRSCGSWASWSKHNRGSAHAAYRSACHRYALSVSVSSDVGAWLGEWVITPQDCIFLQSKGAFRIWGLLFGLRTAKETNGILKSPGVWSPEPFIHCSDLVSASLYIYMFACSCSMAYNSSYLHVLGTVHMAFIQISQMILTQFMETCPFKSGYLLLPLHL